MGGELKSGAQSGISLYFLLMSGSKFLNKNTLALDSAPLTSLSNYVVSGSEIDTTGIYVGSMPTGTPAGRYDAFPFQAYNGVGNEAEGDAFAAPAFTVQWNGTAITDDLGEGIDATAALLTLAEAKQYLAVSSTAQDTILAVLINGLSAWIEKFVNRRFVQQTYTEYYSGDSCQSLQLRNYPIVSVASLHIDNLRVFDATTLVAASNYIVKKNTGVLQAWQMFGSFISGHSNIKVVYDAGFEDIPYDIKMAAKRILDRQYRQGYTNRKLDVSSESISGMNITFNPDAIPKDALSMLAPYRAYLPAPQFEYAD